MKPGTTSCRAAQSTLAGLLLLVGCQTPQQQARELAAQRWNQARAQVKVRLAADQFAAGNVRAAANELNEALQLQPEYPGVLPLRVRVLLAEGCVAEAAELLEQVPPARGDEAAQSGSANEQAELEYLRGVVRQQQQRWEEALEAYLVAVRRKPEEFAYVAAAVQAHLQLGQPQAALELLQSCAGQHEWTGAYRAALAECYEQLGDWAAAAAAWRAVAGTPDADGAIRERLALALHRAGQYEEAIPVLLMLLNEQSDRRAEPLRPVLAEAYLATGRVAAARDQAQVVARAQPENVHAQRLLARALAAAGDLRGAVRVAQHALRLNPQDPTSLELLAALAWKAGQRDVAATAANALLLLDPQNSVAGEICQRLGSGN